MRAWPPYPPTEQEMVGCRLLLLEIIKRAIFDWILYRTSRRLEDRLVAGQAYVWLFDEEPGHEDWEMREREGLRGTSLLGICELLGLDPWFLRKCARKITSRDILNAGRPPDKRKVAKEVAGPIDRQLLEGLIRDYRDYAPIQEDVSDTAALRRSVDTT